MAVSWYSPSAILTPGGVAAGLSDLGQVIASAPERQANIQRQMEADARAKRDQAIQEIQLGANYTGPDTGLAGIAEQQRREREAVALQRKMASDLAAAQLAKESDLASYRPVERAYNTGIIPSGTGDMLRPDVVQAANVWATKNAEERARQRRIATAEDLANRAGLIQGVRSGDLPESIAPLQDSGAAYVAGLEGRAKRAAELNRMNRPASWEMSNRETPEERLKRELTVRLTGDLESDIRAQREALKNAKLVYGATASKPMPTPGNVFYRHLPFTDTLEDRKNWDMATAAISDAENKLAQLEQQRNALLQQAGLTGAMGLPTANGMPVQSMAEKLFRDNQTGQMVPHVLQNGQWVRKQ